MQDRQTLPKSVTASSLAKRTKGFGETIFSEITTLANEHNAVNLGQGFPDFSPEDFVLAALADAIQNGQHQYARSAGHLELVEAISEELSPSFKRSIDPQNEITITVGATGALFNTVQAFIDPGDEAILFEPFYDAYPADVAICGGLCRFVPLYPDGDNGWRFDYDELKRAFTPRTKLIFINTPHNPTGKVYSQTELEQIAELCRSHNVLAVCDEVYEHITFDDRSHFRLASLDGMWERTLTISSAGKTFSVTGWKIGWVIANPTLTNGIRRIHQWNPFAVATPLQLAVTRSLVQAEQLGYYGLLKKIYQSKRDQLEAILCASGLKAYLTQGTYFLITDISELGFKDDVQFCRYLTTEIGVACIPMSPFYSKEHTSLAHNLARFCFCKSDETLRAAALRLERLKKK